MEEWRLDTDPNSRSCEARATCKSDRQLQCGNATLAFGLAIHLAFRNSLAIVGLSLDDDFLKKQIEHGRDQMEEVLGADGHISGPVRARGGNPTTPWIHSVTTLGSKAIAVETLALIDQPEIRDLVLASATTRLRIASRSMVPTLRPGDEIAVAPAPIVALQPGDLILFHVGRELVCHRLVGMSEGALLARGDATSSESGELIAPHQLLGKVVEIRKRKLLAGVKATFESALLPRVLRWLRCLQGLKTYRVLLRPLVAPGLSYYLGLAQGALRYEWLQLQTDNAFPILPRSTRPHLLVGRWRGTDVGWSVLVFRDSAWRCEKLYMRLRYRGLGLEWDLGRLTRLLLQARCAESASNG